MSSILKVNELQDAGGNTILSSDGSGTFTSNLGGGIEMIDMFRLSANKSSSGVVDSNWERPDNGSFGRLGTGLTESSGIFSFPSTGIYLITAFCAFTQDASDAVCNLSCQATTDNSSYDEVNRIRMANPGREEGGHSASFLVDVTDTSNVKIRFETTSFAGNTALRGETDRNETAFIATRIGDT